MKDMPPNLSEMDLNPILSMATLARTPPGDLPSLIAALHATPDEANLFMGMFQIFMATGNPAFALEMQAKALDRRSLFRVAGTRSPAIRLLAFMGPGSTIDNTPLDYLLENADIRLDLLYVAPGKALPDVIPDHDVAIVALCESERNRPLLETLDKLLAHWPRPVRNRPDRILLGARDRASRLLAAIPGLRIPPTRRAARQTLEQAASQGLSGSEAFADLSYPLTIRPLGFQRGEGLEKIDRAAELTAYLDATDEQHFFVSAYIDYRSPDGLFRKARIALIDGLPYICHLAISEDWIVHYVSAHMAENPSRREEEAEFMGNFDKAFALRHRESLRAIAEHLALDYAVIDCAETADGNLLVFEVDNRGWVHATDPIDLFPYKQAPMSKVFAAFRAMLLKAKMPPQHL